MKCEKYSSCYRRNACVTPKFICGNPNPHDDGIMRQIFGRWWGHEGRVFMVGISVFVKRLQRAVLCFLLGETTAIMRTVAFYEPGSIPHQTLNMPVPWSGFPSLQSCKKYMCVVAKPSSSCYFCCSSLDGFRQYNRGLKITIMGSSLLGGMDSGLKIQQSKVVSFKYRNKRQEPQQWRDRRPFGERN